MTNLLLSKNCHVFQILITPIKYTHASGIPNKIYPFQIYHIRSGVMFFWENSSSGYSISLSHVIFENAANDPNNETILKVEGIK